MIKLNILARNRSFYSHNNTNYVKKFVYDFLLLAYGLLSTLALASDFARINLGSFEIPIALIILPILFLLLIQSHNKVMVDFEYVVLWWMLIALAFSSLAMSQHNDILDSVKGIIKQSIYVSNYYLVTLLVTEYRQWRNLTTIYILGSMLIAIYSLYNFYYDPIKSYRLVTSEERFHGNLLAFSLQPALLMCMAKMFREQQKSYSYITNVGILLLFIFCIGLSYSRGIWITTTVAGVIFVLLSLKTITIKYIIYVGIFTILALASLSFLPEQVYYRFLSMLNYDTPNTIAVKSALMSNDVRMATLIDYFVAIMDSPIFGHGLGSSVLENALTISGFHRAYGSHNSYLFMLYSAGIVGFIPMITMLILQIAKLLKYRKILNENQEGVYWGNLLISIHFAILIFLALSDVFFSYTLWPLIAIQGSAINAIKRQSINV